MNDDYEEDYEDGDYDDSDLLQDAKDVYDDIKRIKNKNKNKTEAQEGNSFSPQQEAKEFDNKLKEKNLARSNANTSTSAESAATNGAATGNAAAGSTAAGGAAAGGAAAGSTAAGGAAAGGTAAGGTAAGGAAAGGAAAGGAAAGGAAAGGAAAGGAVAAQAAVPVVGWIALAIEAIIAAVIFTKKAIKKHDQKMAENGVDSKGLRRLLMVSPILIPIALIILILIILVQAETQDKVDFLSQSLTCFESEKGCKDFMNTGIKIHGIDKDLIKATDLEIAQFVVDYVRTENKYYGSGGSSFMSDIVNELDEVSKDGVIDGADDTVFNNIKVMFEKLIEDSVIGDVKYAWHLFKWMKIEKKTYQKINWYKAYLDTASGCATLTSIKQWANLKIFKNEPNIGFDTTVKKRQWRLI